MDPVDALFTVADDDPTPTTNTTDNSSSAITTDSTDSANQYLLDLLEGSDVTGYAPLQQPAATPAMGATLPSGVCDDANQDLCDLTGDINQGAVDLTANTNQDSVDLTGNTNQDAVDLAGIMNHKSSCEISDDASEILCAVSGTADSDLCDLTDTVNQDSADSTKTQDSSRQTTEDTETAGSSRVQQMADFTEDSGGGISDGVVPVGDPFDGQLKASTLTSTNPAQVTFNLSLTNPLVV